MGDKAYKLTMAVMLVAMVLLAAYGVLDTQGLIPAAFGGNK